MISKSPKTWGLWDPFQMAELYGLWMGGLLTKWDGRLKQAARVCWLELVGALLRSEVCFWDISCGLQVCMLQKKVVSSESKLKLRILICVTIVTEIYGRDSTSCSFTRVDIPPCSKQLWPRQSASRYATNSQRNAHRSFRPVSIILYIYSLYSPFLVNSRSARANAELRLVQTELAKLTQSEAWFESAQWRSAPYFIGKMVGSP